MLDNIKADYEVCNCHKISLEKLVQTIKEHDIKTLGELQDITKVGTDCRNCLIKEADLGKIKKRIYCKDILTHYKKEIDG